MEAARPFRACWAALLLSISTAVACGPPPEPKPTPAAPIKVTNLSLAEVGIDAEAMDRSMDPCVNFYLFACGAFEKSTDYPAHRASLGLDDPRAARDEALRTLLEKAGETPGDPMGTFYGACMDEPAVEVMGMAALRPMLTLIDRLRLPAMLAPPLEEVLASLHGMGVPALFSLSLRSEPAGGASGVLTLEQDGLGLPSREHYVGEGEAVGELRESYRQHVARMLTLMGFFGPQAELGAREVLDIESGLAVLMDPPLEPQQAGVETMTVAQMSSPSLNFVNYLATRQLPAQTLAVTSKGFLEGLHKLLEQAPKSALASYFKWMLAHHLAPALGSRWVQEQHSLAERTRGRREPLPRWLQCVGAARDAFGPQLEQAYWQGRKTDAATGVADTVAKDMVAKDMVAKDMVAKVREGVTARVAAARWMAEVDRGSARESLKSLDALLGLPSRWPAVALEVEPRAHTANVLAARAARARQASSAAGQPVDRSSWPMSTLEPALSYLPGRHQLALSAMLLQPPVLSPKATVASTMGSLGPLLARAMLRTVDEHGSQFDGRGKRVAGWHDETRAAFAKRASCLEKQFASDQLRAGVSLDPKRTLRENAVELGALEIAYRLYHEPREGAAERFVADGHNEDQQFFLAYAQSQCTKYAWRTETLRAATEPQAQADLRVNGALRNHSAFGQAFLCTDAAMAPKQRCEVW